MENQKDNTSITGTELIANIVCNSIQLAYKDGEHAGARITSIAIVTQFSDGGSSKVDVSVGQ